MTKGIGLLLTLARTLQQVWPRLYWCLRQDFRLHPLKAPYKLLVVPIFEYTLENEILELKYLSSSKNIFASHKKSILLI